VTGDPARQQILVVDDEPSIVDAVATTLRYEGFDVREATNGRAALASAQETPPDLIVLDVMLPDLDGIEVTRRLRADGIRVPVLFLTARDSDTDKLRGLGLGDDYIVKTASPAEIVARVKTVLRRARSAAPPGGLAAGQVLDFGRLKLDLPAHEVRLDGQQVPVTAREFALLKLLAEHPRRVFPREELFARIWGSYGDQTTVWVHMRRLREKIEPDPAHPEFIITVRGAGYRFEARPR
jgi:DNA-binding response OmpR family regulator